MNHTFLRVSFLGSAVLAFGQSNVPVPFQATTQTIEGSVLHLRGNVQIGNAQLSIIQADEVDFNVATGAIEAHGNVRIPWGTGTIRVDDVSGNLGTDRWLLNKMHWNEKPDLSITPN